MAHEKSITIQNKRKRWVNLDSVHGGKKLGHKTLKKWLDDGHIKPLGGKTYGTSREAVAAAKKRSKSFDKVK